MHPQTARIHSREALASVPPPVINLSAYIHSPAHYAVIRKDYAGLRRITSSLPKLAEAAQVRTESDAIAEESKAEALSAVIDRRDVPLGETPLHLAVRLGDIQATKILMSAGADCSLQNAQGWSALQEAICTRRDSITKIIIKYHQPLAWAKWCRRLPRIVATMQQMRDFYMEVSFNFESSVIPLIARAAPSDTYRIWKSGANLRADTTLSGFEGLKIQRSDQTFLFLGRGSEDGTIPAGSLCVLDHKAKEVTNALEGAGTELTESEMAQEVSLMGQANLYRPGIDVTRAVLVPQLSWMWQEKVENVHGWRAKVYDMHNVTFSVRSREVLGATADEDIFQMLPNLEGEKDDMGEDYLKLLRKDDKKSTEKASTSWQRREDAGGRKYREKAHVPNVPDVVASASSARNATPSEREGCLGWSQEGGSAQEGSVNRPVPPRSSLSSGKKVGNLYGDAPDEEQSIKTSRQQRGRRSIDGRSSAHSGDAEVPFTVETKRRSQTRDPTPKSRVNLSKDASGSKESEFTKNFRPALWLTPDFPLKTEELVPLLDVLASKVKAVRRLRELLTTKLPPGTFPVKIALPVVPTIRVIITFSKFEELHGQEEEEEVFVTPLSSPSEMSQHEEEQHQSSWLSWIKVPTPRPTKTLGSHTKAHSAEGSNLFAIPHDYTWLTVAAKNKGKKKAAKS